MNPRAALAATVLLGGGLLLFRFAHGVLRDSFGDVMVIVFLVACLAAVGIGRPWQRIAAIGVVAVGTELLQGLHLVGPEAHWLLHLTLGSTFDPWDLLAYALGMALAVPAERAWSVAKPSPAG